MNAIDLLKADHRYVDLLFTRIESTAPSKHVAAVKQMIGEIRTHQHIEEKIFYPLLIERGDKELKDITLEGIEEHGQMKKFLQEIGRASASTEKREAKLKVLIEDTRHHVKEEEGDMFSLVEDQFSSEELDALGEKMEAAKLKFQKAKKIAPRKEEAPSTMEVLVEKAKDVVTSLVSGDDHEKDGNSKKGAGAKANASRGSKTRSRGAASR
jgi:hemerythrin-like domain-containing protein